MMKNFLTQKLLFAGCLICLIIACQEQKETISLQQSRLDQKLGPSEEFFLQRAYPDKSIDVEHYTEALRAVQEQVKSRGLTSFDVPWAVQGPGNIGARVNTVAVHPQNDDIMYLGFSQGGVFRTTNGGENWQPIFDDQAFLSIGDIVIDATNPDIIYVGTGDPNISGFPFIGDGVYKSIDGGDTWTNIGLEAQRIVSKIIIDPTNSNILYVATMGLPFERNNDRGLYKTIDGGVTWEQVLFIGDDAGVIDVVMNPQNPQILYAAGWNRIRNNQESHIRGQAAKVYKTIDGGANWDMLEGGLPQIDLSRVGLAMSHQNPDKLYAIYVGLDFQVYNIYKTEDAGHTWEVLPTDEENAGLSPSAFGGFGWYFSKIRVDPQNDEQLFLLGVDLWRYQGGLWSRATPNWWESNVHADKHDLVFNSKNHMILGTDGGAYYSEDNGLVWEDLENIPTTQFYRVAYNPHTPEFYYGGAQDNGTTGGNEQTLNEWERIFGGDGFQAVFHPNDPNIFYVETQNGGIQVTVDGGQIWENGREGIPFEDRRNWNMPYIISPHNPDVLYTGTYRIFKSVVGPIPFWIPISEDLTDGIADRYHTITTLCQSPLDNQLLYVGTSDGKVWRGDHDGLDWIALHTDLPNRYVTDIKASADILDNVYVTHSGYKDNDFIPRVHRSTDRGATWEDISVGLPNLAINDVYVLPNHQDTAIFVATDGGVYGTLDAALTWERLGNNMPIVPVYDLEWNEARNELIAGTFARSIMTFPLDDILGETPVTSTENPSVTIKTNHVKVFPSPASTTITIDFSNHEIGKNAELVILNETGQMVEKRTIKGNGQQQLQLDVRQYVSGLYIIKVKIRHQIITGQFVKI